MSDFQERKHPSIHDSLNVLGDSLQQLNKLLMRTQSASCASLRVGSPLRSPLAVLKKQQNAFSKGSVYLNHAKKVLHSNPSLLNRKLGKCKIHKHHNCEACRMNKLKQGCRQIGSSPLRKPLKTKKRSQTVTKIVIVKNENEPPQICPEQLLQLKRELEDKLTNINKKLSQSQSLSAQNFFLGNLKSSIRSQFSKLRQQQTNSSMSGLHHFSFDDRNRPTGTQSQFP